MGRSNRTTVGIWLAPTSVENDDDTAACSLLHDLHTDKRTAAQWLSRVAMRHAESGARRPYLCVVCSTAVQTRVVRAMIRAICEHSRRAQACRQSQ